MRTSTLWSLVGRGAFNCFHIHFIALKQRQSIWTMFETFRFHICEICLWKQITTRVSQTQLTLDADHTLTHWQASKPAVSSTRKKAKLCKWSRPWQIPQSIKERPQSIMLHALQRWTSNEDGIWWDERRVRRSSNPDEPCADLQEVQLNEVREDETIDLPVLRLGRSSSYKLLQSLFFCHIFVEAIRTGRTQTLNPFWCFRWEKCLIWTWNRTAHSTELWQDWVAMIPTAPGRFTARKKRLEM